MGSQPGSSPLRGCEKIEEQVGKLAVRCTSVTVLLYALQVRDLCARCNPPQYIKHLKVPCCKATQSICCLEWIQKKEGSDWIIA